MWQWVDDVVRGGGVGAMLIAALAAFWLFIEGGLIEEGVFASDQPGEVLMAAGVVGVVSALIVMHALVVGAVRRAGAAAIAQALTALIVVWITLEHREPRDDADEIRLLVLAAVILLDAVVTLWAVLLLLLQEAGEGEGTGSLR